MRNPKVQRQIGKLRKTLGNDLDWLQALQAHCWDGFDKCKTEKDILDALHKAQEEVDKVFEQLANISPFTSDQLLYLDNVSLPPALLEISQRILRLKSFSESCDPSFAEYLVSGKKQEESYAKTHAINNMAYAYQCLKDRFLPADGRLTQEDLTNLCNGLNLIVINTVREQFPEQSFVNLQLALFIRRGKYFQISKKRQRPNELNPGGLLTVGKDGSLFDDGKQLTAPIEWISNDSSEVFSKRIEAAYPGVYIFFDEKVDIEKRTIFLTASKMESMNVIIDQIPIGKFALQEDQQL